MKSLISDYQKYYNLEQYLFNEVTNKFHKVGYLSAEDFFCIVIWKANRAKSKIAQKLKAKNNDSLRIAVKKITASLHKAPSDEVKIRVLISDWKFNLPMASAILSVLFPESFSVYDFRVCDMLKKKFKTDKYHRIKSKSFEILWADYQDYLLQIKKLSGKENFRDADKYLWGKSFFTQLKEDLNKWD